MNVIIKREWNNRTIETEITTDRDGIKIVMSLDAFVGHVVAEVTARLKIPAAANGGLWGRVKTMFVAEAAAQGNNIIENALRAAVTATIEAAKKNTEHAP
jgi:hypothetical protein